jgi:phosphoribosyl 1,2-cyclic phosphodiesterase
MLKVGPYPWSVKQRVMSRKGHLSNDMAAEFLLDHLSPRASEVILGHLSEHNNHPAIVQVQGSQALDRRSLFTHLHIAEPGIQSAVFTV